MEDGFGSEVERGFQEKTSGIEANAELWPAASLHRLIGVYECILAKREAEGMHPNFNIPEEKLELKIHPSEMLAEQENPQHEEPKSSVEMAAKQDAAEQL